MSAGPPPPRSVAGVRFHVALVLIGIGFGFTAPLTAVFAGSLGAGPFLAGIAVSSISIVILGIDVFGTRWTPRLPARGALVAGLLVFGAGSLASAAAVGLVTMVAARALQGIGVGLFLGVGPQLAVRLAGRQRAGRALGAFNAAWFTGIAAGPLLGGWVSGLAAGPAGLRWAFAVCGALCLLVAAILPLVVPAYPAIARPEWGLPRGTVVRSPRTAAILGASTLGQAMRSGLAMTLIPLIGSRELEVPRATLGVALSLMAVTDVSAMYLLPRLSGRWGHRLPLVVACAWGAAVALSFPLVHGAAGFALLTTAFGVSIGASWIGPAELAVELADDVETALSTYRIAGDAGLALGGPLFGAVVSLGGMTGGLVLGAVLFTALAAFVVVAGAPGLRGTVPAGRAPAGPAPAGAVPAGAVPAGPALAGVPGPGSAPAAAHPGPTRIGTDPPGAPMTVPVPDRPTPALFDELADDQGLTFLSARRRAEALASFRAARPELDRLRALPMPFLDPVEPAVATQWIEQGGAA